VDVPVADEVADEVLVRDRVAVEEEELVDEGVEEPVEEAEVDRVADDDEEPDDDSELLPVAVVRTSGGR
jgi:hypothetical protein